MTKVTKVETPEQKLSALIEREREILKKITIANRAMASETVIGQMQYLLDECRLQQEELRLMQKTNNSNQGFDDFLSIG
jgi:hypothetical protein